MSATNGFTPGKTKVNQCVTTPLLNKLKENNLPLQQIENATNILEELFEILVVVNCPLRPSFFSEEGTKVSTINEEEEEKEKLMQLLQKIRTVAISLLNINQNKKGKKRKSEGISEKVKKVRMKDDKVCPNTICQKIGKLQIPPNSNWHTNCYICKLPKPLEDPSWMCVKCSAFNFQKRSPKGPLQGKVALLTGGRIKIGFEIGLQLLRSGALVIVTTRFPINCLKNYQSQNDYSDFKERLHIYELDLRFLKNVDKFCDHVMKNYEKLDILIQNAAQTVRKPTVFYQELLKEEITNDISGSIKYFDGNRQSEIAKILPNCKNEHPTQIPVHPEDFKYLNDPLLALRDFPRGRKDGCGEQLDLRNSNSWVLQLDKVETEEVVEVSIVNYIAPYVILQKLTKLMKKGRDYDGERPDPDQSQNPGGTNWGFIILVSAMEGKYNRYKSSKHPHTNAAKAALNMLVRTSASYYKKMGILMNAVDTGCVTEEHPHAYFGVELTPPLDFIDGASRVLDPIFQTINTGGVIHGKFFKDYKPTNW